MWAFSRATDSKIYYRSWKFTDDINGTWSSSWIAIPNVTSASIPAVVWRDTNHLEVFYKDNNNNVKFIEWAFGEWMPAPVDLAGQINSDLSVISANVNQVAVFGVNSTGLWVRQWTADKQPDWSDAENWKNLYPHSNIPSTRPAVTSLGSSHMAVAFLTEPTDYYNAYIFELDGTTLIWGRPLKRQFKTLEWNISPFVLVKTNANTMMFGAILVNDSISIEIGHATSSNWNYSNVSNVPTRGMVLVPWEPGEVIALGRTGSDELKGAAYTAYGQAQTWSAMTKFTPMSTVQPAQKHSAVAKVGATPYLVWLEKSNTGDVALKSRANPVSGNADKAYTFPGSANWNDPALTVQDLRGDGNDQVIVAAIRWSGLNLDLTVVDPANATPLASKTLDLGVARNSNVVSVAAGDLDGDGQSNEIAVAYVKWGNVTFKVFRYDGSNLQDVAVKTDFPLYVPNDNPLTLSLAIGRFDQTKPNQDVLAVGLRGTSDKWAMMKMGVYALEGSNLNQISWADWSGYVGTRSQPVNTIELVPVDLNGDGFDEIAMFASYGGFRDLWIVDKSFNQLNHQLNFPGDHIEVGDLDGDGLEEIVAANASTVTAYKQQTGAAIGTQLRQVFHTTMTNGEFLVGDVNNDSVTLVADGCEDFRDVKALFVLNMPPRWYPTQGAGVSYAKSKSAGSGQGSTTSTKVGGSLTMGFVAEINVPVLATKAGEIRASVTQDFAHTWAQSKEQSTTDTWTTTYENDSGGETDDPGSTGMVIYEQTKFRCYFFRLPGEPAGSHSVLGISNGQPLVTKSTFEQWNTATFKSSVGASWAPIGAPTNAMLGTNGYLNKRNIPAKHFPVVKTFATSEEMAEDVIAIPTTMEWDNTKDETVGTEKSWEENTTVSAGFTAGNFTMDASLTFGKGGGSTSSTTEGNGQTYGAKIYTYLRTVCEANNIPCQDVTVKPYVYLHTLTTQGGTTYTVHELDYYVDQLVVNTNHASRVPHINAPQAAPLAPIITSPTHADPATWYPTNTVTLNWAQPAGDPATISGYNWGIRGIRGNVPAGSPMLTQTATFTGVDDGYNYFAVVASDDIGQASPVAERQVLVDTQSPTVTLDLNPITTYNGWYNEPVTVTLAGDDGAGSGVEFVEYSPDGNTWEPYSGPLVYDTNMFTTTVWARATDALGHVSDLVSTTFKIDLLPPNTVDCDGYGLTYGQIITTEVGNFQTILGGQLYDNGHDASCGHPANGGLESEPEAMLISTDETPTYRSTDAIGTLPMPPDNLFPSSETQLGWIYTPTFATHGTYDIIGYGVDQAGNQETPYGLGVFDWPPIGAPDLRQTLVTGDKDTVYHGDIVTFTLAVRNAGTEDANLFLTDTVPSGLTVLPGSISDQGQYVPASNAIVWHYGTAWPGETRYLNFSVQVNVSPATTTTLQNTLLLHPYYAQSILSPHDYADPPELTVTGALRVLPTPAGAGLKPGIVDGLIRTPALAVLRSFVQEGNTVTDPNVNLYIQLTTQATAVFIREFTLVLTDTASYTPTWTVANQSGWIPVVSQPGVFTVTTTAADKSFTYPWTLSAGDGVKMLEITAVDANGHQTSANAGNIVYTNLMSANGQTLEQGQRVQYRVDLGSQGLADWQLLVFGGDADTFAWRPRYSGYPNYFTAGSVVTGGLTIRELSFNIEEGGTHILEVQAYTNTTTYRLVPMGSAPASALTSIALTQRKGALASADKSTFDVLTALADWLKESAVQAQLHPARPTPTLVRLPAHPTTRTVPLTAPTLPPAPTIFWYVYLPIVQR